MIDDFLRRPSGPVEFAADGVRALAAVSVLIAAIWFRVTDAGILALTLPVILLPRFLAAPAPFDLAFGLALLVAAWSNVLDLYTLVLGWDLLVHLVCTGLIAGLLYLMLDRARLVADHRRSALVLTTVLALAAAAVWEMIEWFGQAVIDPSIYVTYDDTITDMAAGGVGGVLAGVAMTVLRSSQAPTSTHS